MNHHHQRHSEKSMNASCKFADEVAKTAIQSFRKYCPSDLQNSLQQTVLAAFVLCDERQEEGNNSDDCCGCDSDTSSSSAIKLRTLSLGVGTKFLASRQFSDGDRSSSANSSSAAEVIRDLHAEVLARKSLQNLLLGEFRVQTMNQTNSLKSSSSVSSSFLEFDSESGSFRLAEKCSLHFYTSSTPCGNSTVRKWGSTKSGGSARATTMTTTNKSSSNNDQTSSSHNNHHDQSWIKTLMMKASIDADEQQQHFSDFKPHDQLHVVQRQAGQVALLCKETVVGRSKNKNGNDSTLSDNDDSGDENNNKIQHHQKLQQQSPDFPPKGTHLALDKNQISIPCCSGKIAAWNFLKCWEGLMLKSLFEGKQLLKASASSSSASCITPESIIIGRKFSQVHCQRALCCRVDLSNQLLSKQDKRAHREWIIATKMNESNCSAINTQNQETKSRIRSREEEQEKEEKEIKRDHQTDQTSHIHQNTNIIHQSFFEELLSTNTAFVHHPRLLSTSIKLDDSVKASAEEAANFQETRCFWWNATGNSEVLCGKRGKAVKMEMKPKNDDDDEQKNDETTAVLVLQHRESILSLNNFLSRCQELMMMSSSDSRNVESKDELINLMISENERLQALVNHPLLFPSWPRCDLEDSFL